MPIYRGTIDKSLIAGGESWSNVYTLSALDAFNALEALTLIRGHERAVHYDTVSFDRLHVVNVVNKADQRTNNDGGGAGQLVSAGLGGPLPLFCTVRCLFSNATSKPEQKYLRPPGQEANLTLGRWDGEFTDFIMDNYVTPLLSIVEFTGPSGEAHLAGDVVSAVQNRQLGWHRRTRPGFKRGWVAV